MNRGEHYRKRQEGLQTRPCMCCGKAFESEWIGNRLCEGCRSDEVDTAPPLVERTMKARGRVGA